ncbi:MAG: type I restriction endonuclease subunit R [Candidatus Brocadiia bacterium]
MVHPHNSTEYTHSERPALDTLGALGYEVHDCTGTGDKPAPDNRSDETSVILQDRLRAAIRRLNPWINDNNLNRSVNQLRRLQAVDTMHANRDIHRLLVSHTSFRQDLGHGKKKQTVRYVDYEHPENNDFLTLNQFRVAGPNEVIKPDIVLFVNGLPLGVIECKSPTITQPDSKALDQITRYQNTRGGDDEGAEQLFRYNQFTAAIWEVGGIYGTYGTPRDQYKAWKDLYPVTDKYIQKTLGKSKLAEQDRVLYALFEPRRLLDLLQHYTVFADDGQNLSKLVARYQQYRAVQKALKRIEEWENEEAETNGGVVWHTQGSGKSLTMLFLALKLRRLKENPTLLLVTDRTVLDNQIHATFQDCGYPNPKQARGVADLKKKLRGPAGQTITTLIQKFQENEKEKFPVLSRSRDIFVMVDEAHRTQYKDLANNMRTGLPNAFYIGFTGTPIEKDKRNTRRTFGNYIDQYTIDQSIEDGATKRIFYQGRLADIHLDGVDLDDVFDRVFSDKTDEEKREIRKRYAREQDLAEAPKRIETVTLDLIEHFESRVAEPFKGLVVTSSRDAAVAYKQALDRFNGPESAVVISGDNNDRQELKRHTPSDAQKRTLKKRFKDPADPLKLLVVCDMLLTGFDAPIAQVMYLDRPLKGHNLLQAIARVNRPYEEKTCGLIVDYYGVSEDLQAALAQFSSQDVESAMQPLEEEMPHLEAAHQRAISFFADTSLDDLEGCVERLEEEEKRIHFNGAFKAFSRAMDIVLPDPMANPYKGDLRKLGDIYTAARNRYRDETMDLRGCGQKVKQIIKDHISSTGIQVLNQEPVSILDRGEWEEHIGQLDTDEAKASEMANAVKHEIRVRYGEDPVYYESLQKKVEELIARYKQKSLSAKQFLRRMGEAIEDIRQRDQRAQEKGLDNRKELAFYNAIENAFETSDAAEVGPDGHNIKENGRGYVACDVAGMTKDVTSLINKETVVDWKRKVKVQKQMRRTLKIYLFKNLGALGREKIDELVNSFIELAREHF